MKVTPRRKEYEFKMDTGHTYYGELTCLVSSSESKDAFGEGSATVYSPERGDLVQKCPISVLREILRIYDENVKAWKT